MINIVLATDDNFVQHCSVVIASVLTHNKNVSFYVFTEGLKKENEKILTELANEQGAYLQVCIVEGEVVSQFPMPSNISTHISIATYYRLFVERILPKNIDKVLYMDCDVVVRGSLKSLWDTDMKNKAIGAVYQYNEWARSENSFERLGYSEKYGYFNAGILLINLDFWREHDVTSKLFDFIRINYHQIRSHDQDVLNAVLHQYVKPLSFTWNYLPSFFELDKYTFPSFVDYSKQILDPVIVHFVFKPKPWQYECKHPYKDEYYKYLDKTCFKGWRPKWTWKGFKEYSVIPFLTQLIIKVDIFKIRRLIKRTDN